MRARGDCGKGAWVPAGTGMTSKGIGMTGKGIGIAGKGVGMTMWCQQGLGRAGLGLANSNGFLGVAVGRFVTGYEEEKQGEGADASDEHCDHKDDGAGEA